MESRFREKFASLGAGGLRRDIRDCRSAGRKKHYAEPPVELSGKVARGRKEEASREMGTRAGGGGEGRDYKCMRSRSVR